MANGDLIKGAADMYGAGTGVDFSGMDQIIQRHRQTLTRKRAEKQAQKAAIAGKMASYMENIGDDVVNIAKIPKKYRNQVTQFLIEKKNEYAEAARVASEFDPSSDAYIEAVNTMNSAQSSFENLNEQFVVLQEMKAEDLEDFTNDRVSDGNKIEDLDIISGILTDENAIHINEIGEIEFETGKGSITLATMPKYFNKSYDTFNKIAVMSEAAQKNKSPLSDSSRGANRMKIRSLIEEGGKEAVISLATDGFFTNDSLVYDEDLLTNPERYGELKELVIDQYTGFINNIQQSSYDSFMAQKNRLRDIQLRGQGGGGPNDSLEDFTAGKRTEIKLKRPIAAKAKNIIPALTSNSKGQSGKAYIDFINSYAKNNIEKVVSGDKVRQMAKSFIKESKALSGRLDNISTGVQMAEDFLKNNKNISFFQFTGRKGEEDDFSSYKQYDIPDYSGLSEVDVLTQLLVDIGIDSGVANYLAQEIGSDEVPQIQVKESKKKGILDVDVPKKSTKRKSSKR
jgi:hypothetical protein